MQKNHAKIFLGLLISGTLCFAKVSYGYGIECDASSLPDRAELGETIEFDFTCTNQTTSTTFDSYAIWPVDTNTTEINSVTCGTGLIKPGDICQVEGSFKGTSADTYVLDFNDRFGGETHPSIFCNQPQGCVVVAVQSEDNDTPLIAAGREYTNLASPLLMSSGDQGASWQRALLPPALPDGIGTLVTANCMENGVCIALGNNSRKNAFPLRSADGGDNWEYVTQDSQDLELLGQVNASSCTGSGAVAMCVAAGQKPSSANGAATLLAQSSDGIRWSPITDLPNGGEFNGVACAGSGTEAQCVAVGRDRISTVPLLVQSVDGGSSWSVEAIADLPSNSTFYSTSCTGSGSDVWCVAVGVDYTESAPILAQRVAGGVSWSVSNISGLPGNSDFKSVSCTGSGATAQCVAVGSASLLAQSVDGGASWSVEDISDLPSGTDFKSVSCTGSGAAAQCVAVGNVYTNGSPILVQTATGGLSWSVKDIPDLPSGSVFNSASCTGNGLTGRCVVVGESINDSTKVPLLVRGVTGETGTGWGVVTISELPSGSFVNSNCTGSGATAICVAVGVVKDEHGNDGPPLLAQSMDGGMRWNVKAITKLPSTGIFRDSTCTGNDTTARCVAVGSVNMFDRRDSPLLLQSMDGGVNWDAKSIPGLPDQGEFRSTSCTDDGVMARCVAVGQKWIEVGGEDYGVPSLVQSMDGGASWSVIPTGGLVEEGLFTDTSCTGSGDKVLCIAVGQDLSSSGRKSPLLAQSTDGGASWSVADVIDLPQEGIFYSASCTGSGDTALCVAVGEDYVTSSPLLAQSINGGANWNVKTIADLPGSGGRTFSSASCTGSGTTSVCAVVGEDYVDRTLLLVQNTGDGGSWIPKTIVGLPNWGILYGASCTGDGTATQCVVVGQNFTTSAPLLAQSINGGAWSIESVANSPEGGSFSSVSCTGSGEMTQCVAQGNMEQGYGDSTPLLAQSIGGSAWSVQTISELPTLGMLGKAD